MARKNFQIELRSKYINNRLQLSLRIVFPENISKISHYPFYDEGSKEKEKQL